MMHLQVWWKEDGDEERQVWFGSNEKIPKPKILTGVSLGADGVGPGGFVIRMSNGDIETIDLEDVVKTEWIKDPTKLKK